MGVFIKNSIIDRPLTIHDCFNSTRDAHTQDRTFRDVIGNNEIL